MGKKSSKTTKRSALREQRRKPDPTTLPPPAPPIEEELGSLKLLSEPKVPGSKFKVLDADKDGYDDGGVQDLTLLIDLEDHVLRRKKGEKDYFAALNNNLLPRIMQGSIAHRNRREQKVHLATMLFSDGDVKLEDDEDTANPSEVYMDTSSQDDPDLKKRREDRLRTCKESLKLSMLLREPACAAVALTEISKRILLLRGREGAEDALRCVNKSIELASDGCYDNEDVLLEAEETPVIDPLAEKNASFPGLRHPTSLKYFPPRIAHLLLRAAYLHQGNALSALDRHAEAIPAYEAAMPYLQHEPRTSRIDWERNSVWVNIGNCYMRMGQFDQAHDYYNRAEQLGMDHIQAENGDKQNGTGLKLIAMRARAFCFQKEGKKDDAKQLMREVIDMQREFNTLMLQERAEAKSELAEMQQRNERDDGIEANAA